jgi:Derlin-2/3
MDANVALLDWYWELPIVTRVYLTACFLTTVACAFDAVSPYHLYYNSRAIAQGEVRRRLS